MNYATIIFGYIINLVITSFVHFISYYISTNHEADIVYTKFFVFPYNKYDAIKYFLSPDYWSASSFKKNFHKKDNSRSLGRFIEKSNNINLFVSLIFLFIACFSNFHSMLLKIFIIRAISRSFEIMIAFYDDVVDDEPQKTDLKPGRRISLATKSYFEIIINFTIVYQLLNLCDKKDTGILNS